MSNHPSSIEVTQPDDPLAIAAMILGAISLTGLGAITGIPAIILASIALAHKTPSRSLSLAGLITGILGTVLSIIAVVFFVFLIILGAANGQDTSPTTPPQAQPYSQSRV